MNFTSIPSVVVSSKELLVESSRTRLRGLLSGEADRFRDRHSLESECVKEPKQPKPPNQQRRYLEGLLSPVLMILPRMLRVVLLFHYILRSQGC